MRSSVNLAATILNLRINGATATTIYDRAAFRLNNTPAFALEHLVAQTALQLADITANNATTADEFLTYGCLEIFFPSKSVPKVGHHSAVQVADNMTAAVDFQAWLGMVGFDTTAAITALRFYLTGGNFEVGSKIVVIGKNPL